ncbi:MULTISPECIES: alanine racemase [unclassified Staphylococcus]|uniref:alanine racemase n=1 Tax=unclassified Staphylococcus TaxID=91994 RepID=UPI0021D0F09E|nr:MULTISPECIES: alanine racemase [unclassified Staphylococcus]UXR70847.1 alanine racemase [Staphylococcus sp. IVB6240]UXR75373.1 alanine racemase [Staphylococcus sp. IVB6233]UXR79576.1 alanine racemase [Staphylococcus sp. IVB6218]
MTALWQVDSEIFQKNVQQVKNGQPLMAVVKNNAYNYGLTFAVEQFWKSGIRCFSTTSLKEAVKIRELAPTATIFLMNASYEFEIVRMHDIHMTLPSLSFYYENKEALAGVKVHLEYENLLHRSGFKTLDEILEVLEHHHTNTQPKMTITGLWTHFGYADEFDVVDYEEERDAWIGVVDTLLKQGYQFDMIHAQNSASFIREGQIFPHHTHARVGIALYGSRPYSSLSRTSILQALTVQANVLQVRTVQAGQHCGYSFAYTAEKDNTRLAVVDIGYGDGVLRTRAQHDVLINGKRYPIRALMMSHMFVEVDDDVKAQDIVTLYNEDLRIDDYTFKGVGANSEQLSALNLDSLTKEYQ